MTAEIAILNRLAVALAADSAVSIGRPPNLKIYNTVNKIFELSGHEPVGIMVYGRLDFMGVPYEPLIKEYRRTLSQKNFQHITEYADSFKEYLATKVTYTDLDDKVNVATVLTDTFTAANKRIEQLIREGMFAHGRFLKSKMNGIAQSHLRREIDNLRSTSFRHGVNRRKLPARYDVLIDSMIGDIFQSNVPNATTKARIKDWAGYLLAKEGLSASRTGIVIAGFGSEEMFPSLARFETDGIIDDKLKLVDYPMIDIDRAGPHADILGFAQEDMIKSFLDGIDPSVRKYIDGLISNGIKQTSDLVASILLGNPVQEENFRTAVANELETIAAGLKSSILRHTEEFSANPIRDMVKSMPKQELATLASSLIEITSLKRKVSRTQETVGGEVDVAIISKSEGFVWIKRKHYFPPELNRRFLIRQEHQEEILP